MNEIVDYRKTYLEYKAELDGEFQKTAEGFVRIGYLLKVARDTNILAESGYANVTEFAKEEYNIDKTQVSRFIHINDKFSEGGYSDHLEEHYKGFGYAKLTIMLQLPDELNEELTPDYSKTEIQAIKDEVDAEREITDIEVVLEGESETTTIIEEDLGKTIKQLGEDDPQLYADIWQQSRKDSWSIDSLQELLAPAGQKLYSVRIKGIGRKQMLAKDQDNGNEIVLIDLRTSEKKRYTWEEVQQAWAAITAGEECEKTWESIYFAEWPLKAKEVQKKEQIAPVQPKKEKKPDRKKESKVQKAPMKKETKKSERVEETSEPLEEQNAVAEKAEPVAAEPKEEKKLESPAPMIEEKPEVAPVQPIVEEPEEESQEEYEPDREDKITGVKEGFLRQNIKEVWDKLQRQMAEEQWKGAMLTASNLAADLQKLVYLMEVEEDE